MWASEMGNRRAKSVTDGADGKSETSRRLLGVRVESGSYSQPIRFLWAAKVTSPLRCTLNIIERSAVEERTSSVTLPGTRRLKRGRRPPSCSHNVGVGRELLTLPNCLYGMSLGLNTRQDIATSS